MLNFNLFFNNNQISSQIPINQNNSVTPQNEDNFSIQDQKLAMDYFFKNFLKTTLYNPTEPYYILISNIPENYRLVDERLHNAFFPLKKFPLFPFHRLITENTKYTLKKFELSIDFYFHNQRPVEGIQHLKYYKNITNNNFSNQFLLSNNFHIGLLKKKTNIFFFQHVQNFYNKNTIINLNHLKINLNRTLMLCKRLFKYRRKLHIYETDLSYICDDLITIDELKNITINNVHVHIQAFISNLATINRVQSRFFTQLALMGYAPSFFLFFNFKPFQNNMQYTAQKKKLTITLTNSNCVTNTQTISIPSNSSSHYCRNIYRNLIRKERTATTQNILFNFVKNLKLDYKHLHRSLRIYKFNTRRSFVSRYMRMAKIVTPYHINRFIEKKYTRDVFDRIFFYEYFEKRKRKRKKKRSLLKFRSRLKLRSPRKLPSFTIKQRY